MSNNLKLHLMGHLNCGNGLGESTRLIHQSLLTTDVAVAATHVDLPAARAVNYLSQSTALADVADYPISLICLNGDKLAIEAAHWEKDFFRNRYIIGLWFWETDKLPEPQQKGLPYADEIWACSDYTADAIRKVAGNKPVRVIRHPMKMPATLSGSANPWPFDERFVFLYCFDALSCMKRKNPHGVCRAFVEAFPEPHENGPLLVVKSHSTKGMLEYQALLIEYAHRPDIVFLDRFLTHAERDGLMQRADCYVSLHRAEGLGLTLMESMTRGIPCIATEFSGNLSFMREDNSCLVPCEVVKVGSGSPHYAPEDTWAEPDIQVAAEFMQQAYNDPESLNAKTAAALDTVRKEFSLQSVGAQIKGLLKEICDGLESSELMPDPSRINFEPPPIEDAPEKSAQGEIYENLKKIRQLEDDLRALNEKGMFARHRREKILQKQLKISRLQRRNLSLMLKESTRRAEKQEADMQGLTQLMQMTLQQINSLQPNRFTESSES